LLVSAIEVALFEQMLCEPGVAVADGIGLTVTVAVMTDPAQEPAVGVIV
jgi:ABC-type cobalamin transport system permease subunit